MHIFSILCALTWASASANEFIPRVTKSSVKAPREYNDFLYPDVARFGDSNTLILTFGNNLHISFDDGEHWQPVSGIEGACIETSIDRFHQDRAFILTRSEKTYEVYVTENEGKNWRKFRLPEDGGWNHCHPVTHPFDRKLVLLNCDIIHGVVSIISGEGGDEIYVSDDESIDEEATQEESHFERVVYGSDDAGNNFRRITASGPSPDRTTCTFAASENSVADDDDGIYCIETVEKSEGTEVQSSNQRKIDSQETSFQQQRKSTGILFYTTDLGKTRKTFDELNGFSAERIFVSPSFVAVITSDASDSRNRPSKLWISKGTSFKVASLPEGMFPDYFWYENDQGQLLLGAGVKDNEHPWISHRMLVSDSSGLSFSFQEPVRRRIEDPKPVGNLKGTLWREEAEEESWSKKLVDFLKNFFSKDRWEPAYVAKSSFDNGKTWENLKIVDPSGKHRRIFKCDIDDVENCSLQGFPLYTDEPTAGIIIGHGIAGKTCLEDESWDDMMTFVSRDGGESWEVAFENSVETAILDFGNIIIALPSEDVEENEEQCFGHADYKKFYFSLDQGRSWRVYHFDEPIYAREVFRLESRGLKVSIRFTRKLENSEEYVSYFIDFSSAFGGAGCTEDDLEKWYLSKGNCIDGRRYSFDRRKADAKCLMKKTFGELELHEEKCD